VINKNKKYILSIFFWALIFQNGRCTIYNISYFDSVELTIGTAVNFPINELNKALQESVQHGDSLNVANAAYVLGKYYIVRTYDYPLAYNYFFRSLNLYKNYNLINSVGKSEMQIGLIYYLQNNYNEAISYFEEGYQKMILSNDSTRIARLAYLLSLSYAEIKVREKAFYYLTIAKNFISGHSNEKSKSEYQYGMGKYFLNFQNGDSALKYLFPLYENSVSQNDTPSVQRYAAELAFAWNLKKNDKETEYYAGKVISSGRNINTNRAFMNCYWLLYSLSLKKNKYKEAVKYLNEYVLLKDSIINKNNLFELASLKTKLLLENEKKESDLREAKQKALLIEKQKQARLYQIIAISCLLILILIFIALLDSKRKKRKIESVQQQLINQEKLASMGKLSAGIAHEMLNPLNFVLGFSKGVNEMLLDINNCETKEDRNALIADTKKMVGKITDHANRIEESVQQVLNHIRISPGKTELVNINDLCNSYLNIVINNIALHDQVQNQEIIKNYSSNLSLVSVNPQEIGRVLMNVFSNAFIAMEEKLRIEEFLPVLKITTLHENKFISILITDNGIGIRKEFKEKIFDHFFTSRLPGKGVGLGLSVSKDIIESYGGKITVQSQPMIYTTFTIEIPATM
jgi:two-component system NtrC family sensor kinase